MDTSGKTATWLVAILLVGGACSQPAADNLSTPAANPSKVSAATATPGIEKAGCTVPTPFAWQSLINGAVVPEALGNRVVPFATGANSSGFFAELYSSAWSGVVSVSTGSGAIRRLAAFRDAQNDQAFAGGFDGRWLVWIEALSVQDWNPWEIWAWDSATGQTFRIATSPTLNGSPVAGPLVEPVVSGGKAAWVQTNPAGTGEVHFYSLATRKDAVLSSNAIPPVVFWEGKLIWQHLDVAGQTGHLDMADAASGTSIAVPAPLTTIHHLSSMAARDPLIAWTDGQSIWTYSSGNSAGPSLRFTLTHDNAGFLGIAGDLVTWDGNNGPSALDLRTSSVTSLTPGYGGQFATGNSLVLYWPPANGSKTGGQLMLADVDTGRLPSLPSCS